MTGVSRPSSTPEISHGTSAGLPALLFSSKEQYRGHSCLKLNCSNSHSASHCENLVLARESGNNFCFLNTKSNTSCRKSEAGSVLCWKCAMLEITDGPRIKVCWDESLSVTYFLQKSCSTMPFLSHCVSRSSLKRDMTTSVFKRS